MGKQSRSVAHARRAIAALAARLIAEDGLADFGAAKRKAARHLGFREGDGLPDNSEVEEALRTYQALYQNAEQRDRLQEMRTAALELMRMLAPHHPHLAGPAWKGTATRGAAIDIDVFTDDPKQLEILLLNRGTPYKSGESSHFIRALDVRVPLLKFDWDSFEVRLAIYDRIAARDALKKDASGQSERGAIDAVEALIAGMENQDRIDNFLTRIR